MVELVVVLLVMVAIVIGRSGTAIAAAVAAVVLVVVLVLDSSLVLIKQNSRPEMLSSMDSLIPSVVRLLLSVTSMF